MDKKESETSQKAHFAHVNWKPVFISYAVAH